MRRIRTGRASRVERVQAMAVWQCEAAVSEAIAERRQWAVYAAQAAFEGLPMHRGMPTAYSA